MSRISLEISPLYNHINHSLFPSVRFFRLHHHTTFNADSHPVNYSTRLYYRHHRQGCNLQSRCNNILDSKLKHERARVQERGGNCAVDGRIFTDAHVSRGAKGASYMYDDESVGCLRRSQWPRINQHINNPCEIWQSSCGNWLGEVLRLPLHGLFEIQ